METVELQRKFDLTAQEVEARRRRWSGFFTSQLGLWVPQGPGKPLVHEHTHLPAKHRNLIVNEGLDHVLNVELNALAALAVWYLSGWTNASQTPGATDDYAATTVTELTTTNVAESVRETFNANVASSQSLDNVAGPVAQYTADEAFNFEGAMLMAGSSTFGETTNDAVHILFCLSQLSPVVAMVTLATIDITYTIASSDV